MKQLPFSGGLNALCRCCESENLESAVFPWPATGRLPRQADAGVIARPIAAKAPAGIRPLSRFRESRPGSLLVTPKHGRGPSFGENITQRAFLRLKLFSFEKHDGDVVVLVVRGDEFADLLVEMFDDLLGGPVAMLVDQLQGPLGAEPALLRGFRFG